MRTWWRLRNCGVPSLSGEAPGSLADITSAMSLDQLLEFLAIRVNGTKATGDHVLVNRNLTCTGDRALVQVENSMLASRGNESSTAAKVSVEMPSTVLKQLSLDPSPPRTTW
ncbi:MAG: alkyl sulfatase C-terminal domain-containing protein [Methanoregulaceae archaeon]